MKKNRPIIILDVLSRAVIKQVITSKWSRQRICENFSLDKSALSNLMDGRLSVKVDSLLKLLAFVRQLHNADVAVWHGWLCQLVDDMLDELKGQER